MGNVVDLLVRAHVLLIATPRSRERNARERNERGDVPGWVMVTVMSVGIVMAIWAVAEPQLTSMVRSALASVK